MRAEVSCEKAEVSCCVGPAAPGPGRLILRDEGGARVRVDIYARHTAAPLGSIMVDRTELPRLAFQILAAGLRTGTGNAA